MFWEPSDLPVETGVTLDVFSTAVWDWLSDLASEAFPVAAAAMASNAVVWPPALLTLPCSEATPSSLNALPPAKRLFSTLSVVSVETPAWATTPSVTAD